MNVPIVIMIFVFDVSIFEIPQVNIGIRDQKISKIKRHCRQYECCDHIGTQHPGKTDSAAQN